jgi:hypothetical protein
MLSDTKTRRAALALFGAAPALAVLPAMAMAAPTDTARLDALIAAHEAAVNAVVDADEARVEAPDARFARFSFLGREISPIGAGTHREQLTRYVEFEFEMTKRTMSGWLSPELGEAARAMLETKRADCLAQIAAAHADYEKAASAVDEAERVQHKALEAVCAHRCNSVEELTTKLRYLATWGSGLEENQSAALYKSLLPEGKEIDAV